MKTTIILGIIFTLATPAVVFATESVVTVRVQFSIEESGDWSLSETDSGLAWKGEWFTPDILKVSGTDGSCFMVTERDGNTIQLDCSDLKEISILLSSSNRALAF